MKMTPTLGRVVSVWLCVALVCWFPHFYVRSTESHEEGPTLFSSHDINSEDNAAEVSNHPKNEENGIAPARLSSESVQMIEEGNHQSEDRITEKVKQHTKVAEIDRVAEEKQEADTRVLQVQETSINENPAAFRPQDGHTAAVDFSPNLQDLATLYFEDDVKTSESTVVYEPAASEATDADLPPSECEDENPYDSDSPPLVLENTSNAHTTGTKSHTDTPPSPPSGHGTQHLEANASHMATEPDVKPPVITDMDLSVSSKDPEDIPTFDEWKRKMMEVEKEKTVSTHNSHNGGVNAVKKAQKNFNNYASVECGAKILGANPEAKSTSAILMENMDLYMLNPCGNKVWFIIELCEPIQLKQLDIANFELFSSTPKDFLVSISDRYPTNKWLKLGTFHARDERTVQSFPLDEHLYAKYVKMFTKYIKVELVSHFGSEHFCPLSLIRVFGTSMVEEYEEIADPSDRPDDPDDDLDGPSGMAAGDAKLSNNLIGSAKDAILNMVNNIAVNVLGGNPEMQGNLSHQEVNGSEPSSNLQITLENTTEERSLIPDQEDGTPSSDTVTSTVGSTLEMSATHDGSTEEPGPIEEMIVIPLEKDDEEPISSSITLLDKEVDLEEESEKMDQNEEIQEKQSQPSAVTSSCSFATSLREYLQQKCSAFHPQLRKCQMIKETRFITANQTVPWYLLLTRPDYSNFNQHHSEPHEKELAVSEEPASDAVPPKPPQPPAITEEPMWLEPSQTGTILETSATDSPSGQQTSFLETPSLSPEESDKDPESVTPNEELRTESSALLPTSAHLTPSNSDPTGDGSTRTLNHFETSTPGHIQETTSQSPGLPSTLSPKIEQQSDLAAVPESIASSMGASIFSPDQLTELEPSGLHTTPTDAKTEDVAEDSATSSDGNGHQASSTISSSSMSDIYAEAPNGTEQNGNLLHSSNQKESVFMRLNNRIKALEMNMSLSGRYLEQLSQRYRKQMEEMQKAFNKTIIKLQNTSQIAEEQDQRQTESIQLLQGQLENVTQLLLNLSVRVSQLQSDVIDRQNYLLLSLLLCLGFGLLLCTHNCWISTNPPTTDPEPPAAKNYSYCSTEREFSCDETGLKRSASYPLIHSESLHLVSTEGLERLHSEETLSLYPTNKKRKRRKMKSLTNMETLRPSPQSAGELCNGSALCNGAPVTTNPKPQIRRFMQPWFRDSPSEGSSEASSLSDDPSFCGLPTACSRFCEGLPAAKTRAERRALRRRRPRTSCAVVDLLHAT